MQCSLHSLLRVRLYVRNRFFFIILIFCTHDLVTIIPNQVFQGIGELFCTRIFSLLSVKSILHAPVPTANVTLSLPNPLQKLVYLELVRLSALLTVDLSKARDPAGVCFWWVTFATLLKCSQNSIITKPIETIFTTLMV